MSGNPTQQSPSPQSRPVAFGGIVRDFATDDYAPYALHRAHLAQDGNVFTAEWIWENVKWEVRATSDDGHVYRGHLISNDGDNCSAILRRWANPSDTDAWLFYGTYTWMSDECGVMFEIILDE